MVVARRARALVEEARVDERDVREPAGGSVGVEARDRASDRQVLRTPQREERDVAEVVAAGGGRLFQGGPDRGGGGGVGRGVAGGRVGGGVGGSRLGRFPPEFGGG